jgi:NADP-dependent aldehyde dehydrogenase
LPEKLKQSASDIAKIYAASITLSVGQFCTNPGLIIGPEGEDLNQFLSQLAAEIRKIDPATMLQPRIAKQFLLNRKKALEQQGVELIAASDKEAIENQGMPTIASVSAKTFLENPQLHQEVFGPYSLVIRCADEAQLLEVATHLEGQLTSTLMATVKDIQNNLDLVEAVKNLCGRLILNGVPTGVEVCLSMQHGGPFPATTDSRFSSVGADGIKRFGRPLAFQNWPDQLLPDELKNANPLGIWRTLNDELTKEAIS